MRLAIIGLLALGAVPAHAGDARDGSAAYGGWRDDRPGLTRHITEADLPAPGTQTVASNGARVVPCPPGFSPRVPPGFAVDRVATGFLEPRTLRTAPDGAIFLAESGAGRILVFPPDFVTTGGAPSVFAEGLDQPYGIAFFPPGPAPAFVYVGESGRVLRFPYRPGARRAAGPAQVIIADLPQGGHWTRDLAAAPDGRHLYVAIGSASNLGEDMPPTPPGGLAAFAAAEGEATPWGGAWGAETGRAQVRVFDPDGRHAHAYATGLRNCSGLAISPGSGAPQGGDLWCVVNERDMLGDDLPPDYATHLKPGGFYGWPWFYIGDHQDPRLAGRRPDLAGHVTVPDVLFQPHSAPLGVAFYLSGNFPAEYHGDAFVTLHGSWNRTLRTGYKLVRLLFHDGAPTGAYQDFLTGFALDDDHVCGRPVGVTVTKEGAVLISEDANGAIWRVRWAGGG